MTTFDNLAPYPSPGQDGAALRLAKSYAVLAQANFVRSIDGPSADVRDQGALALQYLYTIVHLVAGLIEEAGDARADTLVSNLLLDLEAPHAMGPDLHAWLTENGIDPAQVDRITRALPEMQRPAATGPRPGQQFVDRGGDTWTYVDDGRELVLFSYAVNGFRTRDVVERAFGPLTPVEDVPLPEPIQARHLSCQGLQRLDPTMPVHMGTVPVIGVAEEIARRGEDHVYGCELIGHTPEGPVMPERDASEVMSPAEEQKLIAVLDEIEPDPRPGDRRIDRDGDTWVCIDNPGVGPRWIVAVDALTTEQLEDLWGPIDPAGEGR